MIAPPLPPGRGPIVLSLPVPVTAGRPKADQAISALQIGFVSTEAWSACFFHKHFPGKQLTSTVASSNWLCFAQFQIRVLHRRDTEGTENIIKTMFGAEFGIVSVISVPPWWTFRTPATGEDLCFAGHDQALQITIYGSLLSCFIIIQTPRFGVK
jgi:hypothetical protein